jgi:hypothetical protein
MIGDGQRFITEVGRAADQLLRQGGAIEEGEGGVEMELGVRGGVGVSG